MNQKKIITIINEIRSLFKTEIIVNGLNVNNIVRIITQLTRFIFWVICMIIVIGLKDFWVDMFTSSPELGGVIMWAAMVIFVMTKIPGIKIGDDKEPAHG